MEEELSNKKYKILLAENDWENGVSTNFFLTREDCQIDNCDISEVILEKIKSEDYDILLIDVISLSDYLYELIKKIKSFQQENEINIPIVVMSLFHTKDLEKRYLDIGMHYLLPKPLDGEGVRNMLKYVMSEKVDS